MGNCIFCGQPAGLLRKRHPECENKALKAFDTMQALAFEAANKPPSRSGLEDRLRNLAKSNYLPDQKIREAMMHGWEKAVEDFLRNEEYIENKG
jgi:hypothetical protein